MPSSAFGNPASLVSGAKHQREVDVERVGVLGFERHYDSALADANVGLGQGWTHSYATRLWSAGEAGLQIHQGDGRRITFTADADGPADPDAITGTIWKGRLPSDGELRRRPDGAWVWHLTDGRKLTFHGTWLVSVEVPGAGALELRYAGNRLVRISDAAGRSVRLEYTSGRLGLRLYDETPETSLSGHLAAVVRPDGTRIAYAYDGRRNLVRATWPDGTSRQYLYEDPIWRSRLTGIVDRRGVRTNRWTYGDDGAVRAATLADESEALALERHAPTPDGRPGRSTIVSGAGAVATWEWERDPATGATRILAAGGDACRTCPPAGPGREYRYDEHGLLAEETEADGTSTLTARDDLGRTVERARRLPDGTELLERAYGHEGNTHAVVRESRPSVRPGFAFDIEYERDGAGLVNAIIERGHSPIVSDEANVVGWAPIERTTRIIRNDGWVVGIDGPRTDVDDVWHFDRSAGGDLVAVRRPDGRDVRFESRDAAGRITRFAIDDEPAVSIERDGDGRPVRIEHRGLALKIEHDAEGHILRHIGPWGRTLQLDHDGAGRLSSLIDDLGRRVDQRHDTDGRLAAREIFGTDGDLVASVALYRNLAGELVSLDATHANADGSTTTRSIGFERDALGRLLALASDDRGSLSVKRDAAGDVRTVALPNGARHEFDLDATRRVSRHANRAAGATRAWHDDFGRLVAEHHVGTGLTRYEFGPGAHWTGKVAADGVVTVRRFDAADRLIETRTPDGTDVYEYDADTGHLIRAANAASDERFKWSAAGDLLRHERRIGDSSYVTSYSHDEHGRLATRSLPNGPTLTYHYHEDGPDAGRLRAITRASWFGLGRETLVGEIDTDARDGTTGHIAHNGLRTVRRFAPNGEPLSIDIERAMRVRYQHDSAGRIVGIDRDGTLESYRYAGDRLSGADTAAGSFRYASTGVEDRSTTDRDAAGRDLSIGDARRLLWNAAGRLAAVEVDGRTIARYAYNAFGERVVKTVHGEDGSRTTHFLYDGTELAAEIDATTGATRHFVHVDGHPIVLIDTRGTHALHTDHLGSVRLATNDAAVSSWAASFGPYGETDITIDRLDQPLRLPGQYRDAETGLHYNLNRYYDPRAARYLSPDPVGLRAGLDRRAYAEGAPLAHTDPLGLATDAAITARDAALPDKPIADQSFTERLQTTFGMVVEYGDLPGEIGRALMEQLSPGNLAATAAVIGLFAALQATPLGWFADIILVGAAWYEFGSIAVDLVLGLVDLVTSLNGASTRADLCAAADRLGGLLAQVVSEFAGDVALFGGAGAVKGSQLIRRLFSSNRDEALAARPRPCSRAKGGDGCGIDTGQLTRERRNEAVLEQLRQDHADTRSMSNIARGPAVSRGYAIDRDGELVETTGRHLNLKFPMTARDDATVHIANDVLTIRDPVKYMEEIKELYKNDGGMPMHPRTEAMIRAYVLRVQGQPLSTLEGAPGAHAEIRALNELFTLSPNLNVSDITLGTIRLRPATPEDFPACSNCSGILEGVEIITGRVDG